MALQATSALKELTVVINGSFRCSWFKTSLSLIYFSYEYISLSPDEGSSVPQLCPAGTFSPAAGLMSKDECQPCRAGYYCVTSGLQAPTAPCRQGENHHCTKPRLVKYHLNNFYMLSLSFFLVGYWCPAGQTDDLALPCLVGHYCPPGSPVPILCPTGTYQDKQKQANCTICESGKLQPSKANCVTHSHISISEKRTEACILFFGFSYTRILLRWHIWGCKYVCPAALSKGTLLS